MITLMKHQEQWTRFVLDGRLTPLLQQHGIPLLGEAGTGKTYPMAHVAGELLKQHGGHALFVVPTRLVWNWVIEHRAMCPDIPDVQRLVINGTADERAQQFKYLDVFGQVASMSIFVGYEAMRLHQQYFQNMQNITVLAADEAHRVKNSDTQTARAIKSIEAKYRFALTGTPITNRPNDLWSILHFLDPGDAFVRTARGRPPHPGKSCTQPNGYKKYYAKIGCAHCGQYHDGACPHALAGRKGVPIRYRGPSRAWGGYNSFVSRYCMMEYNGYGSKITGGRNLDELHSRLLDFGATRWRIDEVLDLKKPSFQPVVLEPTQAERSNYRRVENGIIACLQDRDTLSYFERLNPLAILTYLQQCTVLTPTAFAALRGGLLDEILASQSELQTDDLSSKEEWLLDHMEDTNGSKYLVYAHWNGACDHLMNTLQSKKIKCVGIYGDQGKGKHDAERIMAQFANDPDLRVIVGNESMSEGLNFQAAIYVVFMHLPWVPYHVLQFIARARRIGQKSSNIVYFLSHRGTIDERMHQQCMSKQGDSDNIFDPDFAGRAGMFDITKTADLLSIIKGGK